MKEKISAHQQLGSKLVSTAINRGFRALTDVEQHFIAFDHPSQVNRRKRFVFHYIFSPTIGLWVHLDRFLGNLP